jgi:hypothetical protein
LVRCAGGGAGGRARRRFHGRFVGLLPGFANWLIAPSGAQIRVDKRTGKIRWMSFPLPAKPLAALCRDQLRIWKKFAFPVSLAIATLVCLIGLPFAGFLQANAVVGCRASRISELGLFEFRGDKAKIVGAESPNTLSPVDKVFYLGRAGDDVVLYNCSSREAIRLKSTDKLIISTQH